MQLNASRIKVLEAQDQVVNSIKESAIKALSKISNDKKLYRNLMQTLMVQVGISIYSMS